MRFNKKPQQTLLNVMKCFSGTKSNTAYYFYCTAGCTDQAGAAAPVWCFCSAYKMWRWDRTDTPHLRPAGPSVQISCEDNEERGGAHSLLTPSSKRSFFLARLARRALYMLVCAARTASEPNRIFTFLSFSVGSSPWVGTAGRDMTYGRAGSLH